jgi:hypothetical protein
MLWMWVTIIKIKVYPENIEFKDLVVSQLSLQSG